MRVLIVEDEGLIALGYADIVRDAGHEAAEPVAAGGMALRVAAESAPDIAIVDLRLADGLTGNHVAAELAWRHGTAPILVTGNLDLVTPEAKLACVALLPKPVAAETLIAALDAAAKSRAANEAGGGGSG